MKEEILVAVAGLNPQVITETLYYLTQIKKPPARISRIIVITTLNGKKEVVDKLINKKMLLSFCKEYGITPSSIQFGEDSIILLKDSKGKPLKDIRTVKDNELVADQITEFIKEKTKDPDVILHCSIAGGRKTMSIYLAYALMLFGRKEDTLSHVLVDEKLEQNKSFFYPSKSRREKAPIHLAEIPYVRLRGKLDNLFGSEKFSFSELVKIAQREIDISPSLYSLQVDLKNRRLLIGNREIKLNPKLLALYTYFVQRRLNMSEEECFQALKGTHSIKNNLDDIKSYIKSMIPDADLRRYKFSTENLLQDISKINRAIENALDDKKIAIYYKITPLGQKRVYGHTRYGIHIDRSKIRPVVLT
ncbi:hypothetical protein HRbin37_01604 [bacterium HR37]|nr:hypothetical protein HRbin37_01604 [bacterium HR37]